MKLGENIYCTPQRLSIFIDKRGNLPTLKVFILTREETFLLLSRSLDWSFRSGIIY